MGRKEYFLKTGGYNPNITYAQDFDLWQRMSQFTKLSNIKDIIIKRRIHNQSVGISQRNMQMHCHRLVQQRAISELLERPVDYDEILGLRNLIRTVHPRESISLLKLCKRTFLTKNKLTPLEKRLISRDCAFRIYRIANYNRKNPEYWFDLVKTLFVNPALLRRVFKAIKQRL
jgi:hypothetical protein